MCALQISGRKELVWKKTADLTGIGGNVMRNYGSDIRLGTCSQARLSAADEVAACFSGQCSFRSMTRITDGLSIVFHIKLQARVRTVGLGDNLQQEQVTVRQVFKQGSPGSRAKCDGLRVVS